MALLACTMHGAILMNIPNAPHQASIFLNPRTWLAILPGVMAAGGNPQATAHQSYRVLVAAALDHRVPLDDSLAKYAAASLKKSRSLVTRSNSRLRRVSSSSRGLPVPGKAFAAPLAPNVLTASATCQQLAPERRTSPIACAYRRTRRRRMSSASSVNSAGGIWVFCQSQEVFFRVSLTAGCCTQPAKLSNSLLLTDTMSF